MSCLKHKVVPSLDIKDPSFSLSVVQPDVEMNYLYGNMIATFVEEYEIEYGVEPVIGGYCVFIEGIKAKVGYTDFVVQIDRRHGEGSCEFESILEHEDEHISEYLDAFRSEKKGIERAIMDAANNILPIFVKSEDEFDDAMNGLEASLQNRPEIKLLKQKISAEIEIRNKKVDVGDKGKWMCE